MDRKRSPVRGSVFDFLLVMEATLCLFVARLVLRLVPFRRLSPYLGKHMEESAEDAMPRSRVYAYRVARGIHYTYPRLPWHSTCLVQAIAAMAMLKRRGQESTLYVGVGRETNEAFGAHAWLRSGDLVVTGGSEKDHFKVLSYYMQPGAGSNTQEAMADD